MNIYLPDIGPERVDIFERIVLPNLKIDQLQQYADRHKNGQTEYDKKMYEVVKRKMLSINYL